MASRLAGTTTKEGVKGILSQAVEKPWSALKPLSDDVTRSTTLGLVVAGWTLYDVQTACAILASLLVAKSGDLRKVEGPLKELFHVAAMSKHAWIVYLSKALKDLPMQQSINVNVDLEIFKTSLSKASENLSISASEIKERNANPVLPFHSKVKVEAASQSRVQEIQARIAPAGPSAPIFRNNAGAMPIPRDNTVARSLPRGNAPATTLIRGTGAAASLAQSNAPAPSSGKSLFDAGRRASAPAVAAQKSLFIQPSKGRPGLTGLDIKSPELNSKPLSPSMPWSVGSSSMPMSAGSSNMPMSPLSPGPSSMSLNSPNLPLSTGSLRTTYQHPSKVMTMSIEAGVDVAQQKIQEAARIKQQHEEAKIREKERKRMAAEQARAAKEAKKLEREKVKREKEEIKRREKELADNKRKRERQMKERDRDRDRDRDRNMDKEKEKDRYQEPVASSSPSGHGQLVNLSDLRALKRQRKDTASAITEAEGADKEEESAINSEVAESAIRSGVAESAIKSEVAETTKDISTSEQNSAANLLQIMQSATHLSKDDRHFLMQLYSNSLSASERIGTRQFLFSEIMHLDEQGQSVLSERIFLKVDLEEKTWMLVKRRPKKRVEHEQ